ncbi:MAG: hypothetical protein CMJ34_07245 [Phycisphaerae bacterium]|nr:hypothetical protein [Phycisphaerae bacterium]
MPRRSGPTLYEVMSQSSPPTRPTTPGRLQRGEVDRPTNSRLLTPGSVVRIPVGFVWIGIIAVVGLLALAFWMGSERGYERGRIVGDQVSRSMEEVNRTGGLRREPGSGQGAVAPVTPVEPRPVDRAPVGSRSAETSSGSPAVPRRSGPPMPEGADSLDRSIDVGVERRRKGWTYKVVLYTRLEFAREVAKSIREQGADLGVDAMVERSQNGRFGTVILLPGSPEPFTEQQMIEWDRRIEELAERVADEPVWGGERPFPGHYAEPFGR